MAQSSSYDNMSFTSGFADDVMFLQNGGNRPKSKMTCTFRPVHQVATPTAKCTVCDCILFVLDFMAQ